MILLADNYKITTDYFNIIYVAFMRVVSKKQSTFVIGKYLIGSSKPLLIDFYVKPLKALAK
jgi:hypothetical protein